MATFSYADAVKLLGAKESKIVTALDKLLGGVLLGGSLAGVPDFLSWFDAKADFIKLSHEAVTSLSERRSGLSRYDRTQRVHAAHSVITLVAFFEGFDELGFSLTAKDLDLTKQRQLDLQAVDTLFRSNSPLPAPDEPYQSFLVRLETWYAHLTGSFIGLIGGLALWEKFDETRQDRVLRVIYDQLPQNAVRRYEELFRRLCAECPEVGLWVARLDVQATQAAVGTALQKLQDLLDSVAIGDGPAAQRAELALKYRSQLGHPILESEDVPGSVVIPSLNDSYVDPFFQAVNADPSTPFAKKSWWDAQPVRTDIHQFLAGFLTSPQAVEAPLLVLGDPGSGKSVLTKVLAARLPASDFLVVRVELRTAPAEADILRQIEHGLTDALKEEVSWPGLVRSASQALPVVLLDGFDELLQATGVNQTDYLARIARFQRDRADIGHPTAFVVTSRISVSDRATPPPGTMVLRLVPFVSQQIGQWLDVWSKTNGPHLARVGLTPLTLDKATQYAELCEQPLLLLMLALYDADENALQRDAGRIDETDLYERLLTRFASREVRKDGGHRTPGELAAAIAAELKKLSIVAFAMFNRGAVWVTERDLDADFAALLGMEPAHSGMRSPLGTGGAAIGRFFFVQRSQASRDQRVLSTYEFLHATFGEYLVARLTWQILRGLPRQTSALSGGVDDSDLYTLLSFAPLCDRSSVIDFLNDLAGAAEESERVAVAEYLAELFQLTDRPRSKPYRPAALSAPARHAVYSVNLLLLSVAVRRSVLVSQIFRGQDAVETWRRHALLWKSQLSASSWDSVVRTLSLVRMWSGDDRDIRIWFSGIESGFLPVPSFDAEWLFGQRLPGAGQVTLGSPLSLMRREIHFVGDGTEELMLDALEAPYLVFPEQGTVFARDAAQEWMSGVHALLGFLFGEPSMRFTYHNYLQALTNARKPSGSAAFDRMVFLAAQVRADEYDPHVLAGFGWISSDPRFWSLLCGRMGKRHNDRALVALLRAHWDEDVAVERIPEDLLDAWLRMAERGTEPADPSLGDLLWKVDLAQLARSRPDLVNRARHVLADRGSHLAIRQLGTLSHPPGVIRRDS